MRPIFVHAFISGLSLLKVLRIILNLTLGLIGALFSFMFSLYGLVSSYQPDFFTAFTFYAFGLLAATSVVVGLVGAMFTVFGGTIYGGAKILHAIAEDQQRQQRIR